MPEAAMNESASPGVVEWFLRRDALAAATRAQRTQAPIPRENLVRARAAFATAERLARTGGDFEAGYDDDAVATGLSLGLYREAAYWALTALYGGVDATDLASAMRTAPGDELARAAGGAGVVAAASAALVGRTFRQSAELATPELRRDAAAARAFVAALLRALDARAHTVPSLRRERASRVAALLVVIAAVALGVHEMTRALARNLVEQAPWRVSSALEGTPSSGVGFAPTLAGHAFFFHTREEASPWIEFDLGRETPVASVAVENRTDCCGERAVPLVFEVSTDRTHWTEVAREPVAFQSWTQPFASRRARYVRLRVPRTTTLHLESVTVH